VTARLALALLAVIAMVSSLPARAEDDSVRRGEYLARAAGCSLCHTADPARPFAGGRPVASFFGEVVAPNITPDAATGIGQWSEEEFLAAVQRGLNRSGQPLYPAMPYAAYTLMSREDVLAIRAFLMAQPPIRADAAQTTLSFPFNQRWLIWVWRLANFRDARFEPPSGKSEAYRRGAYLVEAVAHCGTCHTPSALPGPGQAGALSGGSFWAWQGYNITADPIAGIGGWSDSDLDRYLSTGAARGRAYAAGPMAETIDHGLRYLSEDDIAAIRLYLRDVAPVPDKSATKARFNWGKPSAAEVSFRGTAAIDTGAVTSGAELYSGACASCHGSDGAGTRDGFYPALFHNTTTGAVDADNLVLVILDGVRRAAPEGAALMPGFRARLDDAQVAAVANFVTRSFGNPSALATREAVMALRRGERRSAFAFLSDVKPALVLLALLVAAGLVLRGLRRRKVLA
jgi:mono/diheme cytochrome c family protein